MSNRKPFSGFTLVELLAVIAIIGVLTAFTIPILRGIARTKYLNTAKAEMGQLETAIDSYHSVYGFYPPDNGNNVLINQLYYELEGTTNDGTYYTTLDGATQIKVTDVSTAFQNPGGKVEGFLNCSKAGSGPDTVAGRNFIHELVPRQTGAITSGTVNVTLLTGSIGGPDTTYQPLGVPGLNPWRYKSSGILTNNPGSYELWIQLVIDGKTHLVCNWNKP